MGLSSALSMALSGLNANQRGLQLAATNVANADTPGYTAKTLDQSSIVQNGRVIGLESTRIQRSLDEAIQAQLRTQSASSTYADRISSYQSRLDELLGTPGSSNGIDALLSNFTGALEGLSTTPESYVTRAEALTSGRVLASQLNSLSADIQAMRQENETFMRNGVDEMNAALQNIKRINDQILTNSTSASGTADLQDQRDIYIDQLSHYMDVRVAENDRGGVRITTSGGASLFDGIPVVLEFDGRSQMTPQAGYSINPDERSVGTISMTSISGSKVDLLQPGLLRGGAIAAARDLRDGILVEAQAQLDQFASAMASAMGNRSEPGNAVTSGTQAGFDLDLSGLQPGNVASFSYTDATSGKTSTVSFVRVDDPASLPLSGSFTGRTDDSVVGLDFSGGMGSVAAQMQSVLGGRFQVSDEGGNTIRILDDGVVNAVDIVSVNAEISTASLTGEGVALPFFVDSGGKPFSNSVDGRVQFTGFASRITVNANLIEDNSRLVVYDTSPATLDGDSTRPLFMFDALTSSVNSFTADGGIGTTSAPFTGTLGSFVNQIISVRGAEAAQATSNANSQRSVVNILENRFAEGTEVSIDAEMARLVELQTSYAANARVMQVVQELLAAVLRI
uniref:flagellar hook-associated protein FlgK n=1 Tax=Pararhizobium sp. IMCC3301 TaxID=3067904 RepID=UPI0027414A19|nr:flagellar hook-associated protein FlgK [Pararhizobium sp. IMCC3301]